MIGKFIGLVTLSFLLVACGNDSSQSSIPFEVSVPKSCSLKDKNQFVYDVLKDSYFWSDKVGDLDISLESNESMFLDHFLYKKKDRFSFLLKRQTFDEVFTQGDAKDFGFLSALIQDSQGAYSYKVTYVYRDSPAFMAGIHRADTILAAKDINTTATLFRLENSAGEIRDVTLQEKAYHVKNISHTRILNEGDKKVGYFLLHSFIGPDLIKNLDHTFDYFSDNHIDELVIDLRYNGGGLLDVARYLGSLVGGKRVEGHIFERISYNKKYHSKNYNNYFPKLERRDLNLDRVFILTTYATASASEALINSLRASENHIKVITIGQTSYGKPYGMQTISYCDRVLVPIHFIGKNSDGYGDYTSGIVPTCEADDSIDYDFANPQESLLKETLYYIDTGACRP